jgi:hypothetical protein
MLHEAPSYADYAVPVTSDSFLCLAVCSGDLDVVLKLRCHSGASFDSCRREVLTAVEQQLCRPAAGPDNDAAAAAVSPTAGWRLKPCHSERFVRLEHPQLQLQLDVQVGAGLEGVTHDVAALRIACYARL